MRAKSAPGIQNDSKHPDYLLLHRISIEILNAFGGHEQMGDFVATMLREVIDDVIDTGQTGRRFLHDIEKTEKTYLGTKIEIILRHRMGFAKGKALDLVVGDEEVDIKFTMGGKSGNWMVPMEAVGRPLLLVAASEQEHLCWMGLIVANPPYLSPGENRDRKRTISQVGFDNIFWLLKGRAYEPNFWANVPQDVVDTVFDRDISGAARVMKLFQAMRRKPIPRRVVQEVAQQLDFTRRVRGNGGARDLTGKDFVILSDFMGSDAIRNLGIATPPPNSYVGVDIRNAKERAIIENSSQTRNTKAWRARRPPPRGPISHATIPIDATPLDFTEDADPDFEADHSLPTIWSK